MSETVIGASFCRLPMYINKEADRNSGPAILGDGIVSGTLKYCTVTLGQVFPV